MTETTRNRDKLFNALDDSFRAMLDAINMGNERGYRFSRRLLNEAEQGQRELVQLGRRFARQPKDMRGLYEASVDLARRATSHSAELAGQLVGEGREAGRELRETAAKVIQANRSATQALSAALRQAATGWRPGPRARRRRPAAAVRRPRRRIARRTDGEREAG